nr:mucin-2-like [Nerophis lumbriciformis]
MCDFIFFETFGGIFIRTIVIGFRPQMGNTQVEVQLQFNNSVSTDEIPEADVVVDTLVQAVNSPNNTFNLTLDSDSIAVIQPETTTRVSTTQGPTTILVPPTNGPTNSTPTATQGSTTAVTSVPSPVVSIEATVEEPFVPEFNDPNSEQYQTLQTQVISMCDFIFFETFGSIFIGTIVIGFRPQMGNTQVEVLLQFNNSVSTDQIPEAVVVVDTLVQAVNSPNNTFNLTLDSDSIAVIQPETTTRVSTTQGPTTILVPPTNGPTNSTPTTTHGPTTAVTSVPSPVVSIEATVEEPFVPEFNDPNSEQYQTLQTQVISMCDFIFFETFGSIFIGTIVTGFRPQMGNTQVEVQLLFNNSVSTDQIPEADVVVDTLVQAVNSPNNTFNLTLDSDSIAVIQPETTTRVSTTQGPTTILVPPTNGPTNSTPMTTHGPTTAVTSVPSPVVSIEATVEEPFVPEFNDPNSEQYQTLQTQVISMCDFIFFETFGSVFIGTIVTGFRPQMGNTQVEVQLQFNNSVSTDQIPEADVVVDTLVQAVNSPNNTFNLTLDSDSIAVIQPETTTRVSTTQGPTTILVPLTNGPTNSTPTTTHGPTTAVTSVQSPVVSIEATVEEPFVPEFNDPNSEQYQTLQTQVISMCDFIFFEMFGSIFIGTIVIGFRPQMGNTQVEVQLLFNNSVSTDQIPEADVVVDTLVQAVNSPNNTFNLTLDSDSIAVIQPETTTRVSTTQGPTTILVPPTNGPTNSTPTTTHGPTTAVTSVPSPVVSIEATVEEPFVPEFNDPNSEQYQTLQTQVISMCDFIFFETFGGIFIGTIVIGFRPQMGNTQVEVQLQFNNSVSTDQIPGADVVVDTLVQAVNSPNNTFNLTLDSDSIAVIQPETTTRVSTTQGPTTILVPPTNGPTNSTPTTTHGPTTAVTSVPSPVVSIEATVEEPFVPEFNDPNSEQYQTLQTQVISMCDFIFFETFGGIFIGTIVIGFRPQMGNTQVEVQLQFNNSVSTDQIPEADVVVDTLVQAVNSPNNTFNLTLDSDSIAVIQPETTTRVSTSQGPTTILVPPTNGPTNSTPTTTHGPTTAVTSVPSPVVSIEATVEEPFVQEFNDPNSEQYQTLQTQVISMCDFIFFETFGSIFIRTIVIGFRPQMGNTQVEVQLQFNNSVSTDQIPEADVVVDTLVQAVNSPNNTFNLTLDSDSIKVIQPETTTRVSTTQGPTTILVPPTNGPTNSTPMTTHGPTTAVTSVPSPVVSIEATVEEPFVQEFNDPNSEQYQTLQTQVISMCDFIFFETFGSIFIRTIVIGFRPQKGNTQVEVELQFNNSVSTDQIPEADVVVDTLVQALNSPNNTFNLTLDSDSIAVVQPESTTPGSTTQGPTTTLVPTVNGPTTTLVSTTNGPTFTTSHGQQTTMVPTTNGPTNIQSTTTHGPIITLVPTTHRQTATHVPTTQGPTTTLISTTRGPTTALVPTAHGQTFTQVSTTNGQQTTLVPTTHGPLTTLVPTTTGPTATHVPGTQGPTTTLVPTSHEPTTTQVSTTQGQTTTLVPTTLLVPTTNGPTTTLLTINGQTATQIPTTNRPTTTQLTTHGPTTTMVSTTNGPTFTQVPTSNGQQITLVPTIHGPLTTPVPTTNGPTATNVPTTHEPTTTLVPTSHEPTTTQVQTTHGQPTTLEPITQGPTTTQVSTTHGPTTTQVPTNHRTTTTQVSITNGQTTTLVPTTNGPTTTLLTINGQTATQIPTTNGPTIFQLTTTHGPTTTMVSTTNGPTFTQVSTTNGQQTTLVPTINGPLTTPVPTTNGPTATHVPTTHGPTTTLVPTTHGPTTLLVPTTHGQTTTLEPITQGPTTTQVSTTHGPTTTQVTTTHRPTTIQVSTTNGQTTTELTTTHGPITTLVSTMNGPTFNQVSPTQGQTTTLVPTTHEQTTTLVPTTLLVPTTHGQITTLEPITHTTTTHGPTTSQTPTTHEPTTTHGPTTIQVPATNGPTTIHAPTTMHGPTPTTLTPMTSVTTAAATSSQPVVILSATLEVVFTEDFNNITSVQYRDLETQVVSACNMIYRERFGLIFLRTFVIRIIRAVVITRMDNTQVDVGLEFRDIESTPQNDDVVTTLEETLRQPNNSLNISIVQDSIKVIQSPNRANSTTAKPSSTTKKTTMTPVQLTTRTLRFTSDETFTSDLLNQSSAAFVDRARIIKTTLEPFYSRAFSSFNSLTATSFSNGSIINNMDLRFTSGSVPNNTAIGNVLIAAAPNITAFNVNTTSIFVNGMQVSSGASHLTSIIGASCLGLLSWLLSCQH